jgi:Zn-dependent protease
VSSEVSVGAPRNAFVPSPVFVGIILLTAVSGWMAWTGYGNVRVDVFLLVVCGWLLSLCLHEYAHALVAYLCGDRSVAERGYLRLNPLKYTNPLLSIVLPVIVVIIGGIGLPGGAVWVDHSRIRTKTHESLISLAGPATNMIFALAIAAAFWLGPDELSAGGHPYFWIGLATLGFLQVTASVLNFLPVPGLDGGNIIRPWLSPQYQRAYALFAPYGFILLFVLLWQSRINRVFFAAVGGLTDLVGIPSQIGEAGITVMRFWSAL